MGDLLDCTLGIIADVEIAQATVEIDALYGIEAEMFGVEQGSAAEEELEQITTVLVVVVGDTIEPSEAGSLTLVDTEVAEMFEVAMGEYWLEEDVFAGEEKGGVGICSEICVGWGEEQ